MSRDVNQRGELMGYIDALFEPTRRRMMDEAREHETLLVHACRRGEPFVDFPNPIGGVDRKILPKTLFGRWWKLRKAGYRLRGPK